MVILNGEINEWSIAEMLIKKSVCLSLVFMSFTGIAFAAGAQFIPESERSSQPQSPTLQTPFNPTVLPAPKATESQKPIEASTLKEVAVYERISLQAAIDYALSHNLDIAGNRINIDIARNNIKLANRLQNPYIQTFFNFGKAAEDNPNYMALTFPIELFKRGSRKNLAKSNLALTKGNVALAEFYLRLDVRQSYIDLVSAKSILKILNDQRQLLQDLLDIAQKKYDAGAVPQMDVIHAKMTLNQLLTQVNTANTGVYVARYNFNKVLNSINYDTKEDYLPEQNGFISVLTPKPTEKMPDLQTLEEIAVQKRLDLKNAQKEIDVAQKNLITIVKKLIPDLEVSGGYMYVPGVLATANRTTQGVVFLGNITNIPLFYQYTPEIKNAKLQVEQKQLAYESLKRKVFLNLHSAYDEFNTAQDNLNYYTDILLAESNQFVKMARRSYQVGKSSITDFIFIEQSYKNIMMNYVQALSDYYDAWINVVREVNDEGLLHG